MGSLANRATGAKISANALAGDKRDQLRYATTGEGKPFGYDYELAGRFADEAMRNEARLRTTGGAALNQGQKERLAVAMGNIWKAHPGSIDRFANELEKPVNKTASDRYHQLSASDAGRVYEAYATGGPRAAGLKVTELWYKNTPQGQAQARVDADAAKKKADTDAATKARADAAAAEAERKRRAAAGTGEGRDRTRTQGGEGTTTPDPKKKTGAVSPIDAAAGAGGADGGMGGDGKPPPVTPGATTGGTAGTDAMAGVDDPNATVTVNGDLIRARADQLGAAFRRIDPNLANVDSFIAKLKDPKSDLADRIAANLNKHPDVLRRLQDMSEGKDQSETDALLKKYGMPTIREIVDNPENLADDSYVTKLSGMLEQANGGGGIMGLLGGIDWSNIWEKIKEGFNWIVSKVTEFFSGFSGGNKVVMAGGPNGGAGRDGQMAANMEGLATRGLGTSSRSNVTRVGRDRGDTSEETTDARPDGSTERRNAFGEPMAPRAPGVTPPAQPNPQLAGVTTPKPSGTDLTPPVG